MFHEHQMTNIVMREVFVSATAFLVRSMLTHAHEAQKSVSLYLSMDVQLNVHLLLAVMGCLEKENDVMMEISLMVMGVAHHAR